MQSDGHRAGTTCYCPSFQSIQHCAQALRRISGKVPQNLALKKLQYLEGKNMYTLGIGTIQANAKQGARRCL